jgi:hypothetical protein
MMDFDGDSDIFVDDLDDCFITTPADCNGNGTEDMLEIVIDLTIDANDNKAIDCCNPGPATEPNPVGNTLLLNKDPSKRPVLIWTAPPVSAGHTAATGYTVFRSTALSPSAFGWLANPSATTYTDTNSPTTGLVFYLVGARNSCGSSGEEPF